MDCPVCKTVKLVMSDRQGVEIDYCPNCRGVWLDRGELDKIIDRASADTAPAAAMAPAAQVAPVAPPPQPYRNDPYQGQPQQNHGFGHGQQQGYPPQQGYPQHGHYKKKKKGFLGELFDFD